MIKKILIFTSFLTVLLNGMQKKDETISLLEMTKTSVSIICNQTKIHLTKEPLLSVANNVNRTILGSHQQALLSGKFNTHTVGTIADCPYCKTSHMIGREVYITTSRIYTKNNDNDSGSEDDNYKPYPYNPEDEKKTLYKGSFAPITRDISIITEPCINLLNGEFVYNVLRENQDYDPRLMNHNHTNILLRFTGNKAIQEASSDLSMCYREILRIMADYYISEDNPTARYTRPNPKSNINIAIPLLSAEVGFPRDKAVSIAIAATLDFLQEYPEGFDNIYLVIKKRSELTLGKKLLMEYCKPINIIYLLYWIHKDPEQDISHLPKEIIDSIVQCMLNSSLNP